MAENHAQVAPASPKETPASSTFEYATSKDWLDIMKNRSKLRMHELIERLGLRAKWSQNKRGKTNFEGPLIRDLVNDMGDVVTDLPKEPDEIVAYLSQPDSLREQVNSLLDKHGQAIWGRASDREHLITVGEPGVEPGMYPRDLYFEDEQDRLLISKLLHWWLGMKAINVILARDRLERERKKKDERRTRLEMVSPQVSSYAPIALAPPGGMLAAHAADVHAAAFDSQRAAHNDYGEARQRGSPRSVTMATSPGSSLSPVPSMKEHPNNHDATMFGGQDSFHRMGPAHDHHQPPSWERPPIRGMHESWTGSPNVRPALSIPGRFIASSEQITGPKRTASPLSASSRFAPYPLPAMSSIAMRQDVSRLVEDLGSDVPSRDDMDSTSRKVPPSTEAYRGLDQQTLQALRAYIYHEDTHAKLDECSLLRRLERAWRDGVRTDKQRVMDDIGVFLARERVFLVWLEMKRHLADLDRAEKRWREEGTSAPEIERRIQQHQTLMRATEEVLRSYDMVTPPGGSGHDNDELLRQAFVVLAGERYAVEMQWKSVEFDGVMRWLAQHLAAYQASEAADGEETYFVG